MIKIVHVITETDRGGAETMLLRLITRMDPAFRNIVVSLTDKGTIGQQIERSGFTLHALRVKQGVLCPVSFLRLVWILRKERPAILQTWLYHADLLGLLAAKCARVPKVVWNLRCSCVDAVRYPPSKRMALGVLKRLSAWPDAVIVNSQAGQEAHRRIGYRPRRWVVVPNGFDLDSFRPRYAEKRRLKETYYADGGLFLIGLVARWDPLKDHDNFLEAAKIFLDKYGAPAHVRFVLVGAGLSGNPILSERIASHGLGGRVVVFGESLDVADIMSSFDVCTSSSWSEGFPNTLGEAMACGVPCVTTDAGDSAFLVGETGIVVPVKEPQALADAWQKMLTMGEEGRQRLGMRARERVTAHFSIDRITARYEDLYAELATGSLKG